MSMKIKPIIKIQTSKWNKRTKTEQDKALFWIIRLVTDLSESRKTGISDDFWGQSEDTEVE